MFRQHNCLATALPYCGKTISVYELLQEEELD
jgi:hypothetical protein